MLCMKTSYFLFVCKTCPMCSMALLPMPTPIYCVCTPCFPMLFLHSCLLFRYAGFIKSFANIKIALGGP